MDAEQIRRTISRSTLQSFQTVISTHAVPYAHALLNEVVQWNPVTSLNLAHVLVR
ncbi:uncharacterized protein PHACADRAFT_191257 [Phanerochaete carnosa HHB-10118-sp]|uniref:Uncharacterized protein n=1 Tax=Phanerochaete carnosa (strain HHB-10118-sp) TaxID=650164 RepID=K5W4Y3_PHACS|nr:uncharacterized protein PHACADRAFT_191257 [Phanerochaete carnosa HHB-10118-sp]EKM58953.1 hypothetical protein PHACADRAFT_191257 [Phanerochaete carnosa HHB-10118-sp]